jgi:putative FmdB family regulatory protein
VPIYEYICHSCGNEFEQLQGWSDSTPSCSACSSQNVTRRLSPPAIHFKGSGWYITDSKNGKNGANGVSGGNGAAKDSREEKSSAKESASESGDSSKETSGGSEAKSDAASKKESGKVKASE